MVSATNDATLPTRRLVMFGTKSSNSSTGTMLYMASLYRDDKANERGKPYTTENIAFDITKHRGFVGKAVKFTCLANNVDVKNDMVCYRMSGARVFDDKPMEDHRAAVAAVAVSLKNNTMGYAFIGEAIEEDVPSFKNNPTQTIKNANGASAGMFRNSRFTLNLVDKPMVRNQPKVDVC